MYRDRRWEKVKKSRKSGDEEVKQTAERDCFRGEVRFKRLSGKKGGKKISRGSTSALGGGGYDDDHLISGGKKGGVENQ